MSHPALIADRENSLIMRMQEIIQKKKFPDVPNSLEVNPNHPIIQKLDEIRTTNPKLAEVVAFQILDNAKLAAGILNDPKDLLERWNILLEKALGVNEADIVDK